MSTPPPVTRKPSKPEDKLVTDVPTKTPYPFTPGYLFEIGCYIVILAVIIYQQIGKFIALFDQYNSGEKTGLKLMDGIIPGRKMDAVDIQFKTLVLNLDAILGCAFVQIIMTWTLRWLFPNRPTIITTWNAFLGVAFSIGISGTQTIFPLGWLLLNFILAKALAQYSIYTVIVWVLNAYLLYFFDAQKIYFGNVHSSLAWMDQYRGFYTWNAVPYFFYLKMMSFLIDYQWMVTKRPSVIKGDPLEYKSRVATHGAPSDYSYLMMVAYTFYFPTWVSGPTATANSFISHMKVPQVTHNKKVVFFYVLRTIFAFAVKMFFDHYLYFVAYMRYAFTDEEYKNLGIWQLGLISYFTLKTVYLKFLCIWRLHRMIALIDGIEVPENMNRCMSDNYTITGFWRAWHKSFNEWLVRYVYVPLGGSRVSPIRQMFNTWLTFSVVIFAHAPSVVSDPQILVWGWAMAIFMIPEILASAALNSKTLSPIQSKPYFRHLQSIGGAFTTTVLVAANLCGYGISLSNRSAVDATKDLVMFVFQPAHWYFLLVTFFILFISTQIMLAWRKYENYTGRGKSF